MIDKQIAEKVMGLTKEEAEAILIKNLPEYSTNIADAWLVVERMQDLGFSYSFFNVGLQHQAHFMTEDIDNESQEKI
jgi:ABA sandwich protein